MLTGGEDAKLNVWSSPGLTPGNGNGGSRAETADDSMDVDEDGI